jgi:hypothetical protein
MAEFGATARDIEHKLPRAIRVKNKAPADKQITAEQLLREAKELQLEDDNFKPPKQIITDPEELAEYRLRKRKEYEDLVRRVGRFNMGVWVKVGIENSMQFKWHDAFQSTSISLLIHHSMQPGRSNRRTSGEQDLCGSVRWTSATGMSLSG